MALGKGIPVINGFDLNSKLPLDSRAVADTMEDMNALVTNGSVTDGQLCYCKADKKLYVLKDGVWSEVGGGGGGKSVPPTLWLIDLNNYEVRTTITEEEYNNLKNGLYNQVMYSSSVDEINLIAMYNPSKLFCLGSEEDGYQFIFTYFVYNENFEISGLALCNLSIGEKNTNNEYPFTVENNLVGLSGTIPIYEATYDSTSDKLTLKEAVSGSPNILFVKYTNNNGNSYTWLCFTKALNISDSFGWQCIDYGRNKVHTIIDNDTSIETIDQGLGQETTLFNRGILVPPSSNVTPILPCTTADNGKVLSVVNGEAQWANAGGDSSRYKLVLEYGYIETGGFPQDDTTSVSASFRVAIDLLEYLSMETIIVYANGEDNPVMFNVAKDNGNHKYNSTCFNNGDTIYFYYLSDFTITATADNKYNVTFKVRRKTIPTSTTITTFED